MIGRGFAAVLAAAALSAAATWPFVTHLATALPAGRFDGAAQLAFWLPWQIYANVRGGRGIDDASVFAWGGDAGLVALTGPPGMALLEAPLQAIGLPVLAHNLAIFLVGASNALALGVFALTSARRESARIPAFLAGAAAGAGCATWWADIAGGAAAAGWVAPAVAALILAGERRPAWVSFCVAVPGLVAAPLVTALGAAVGGGRLWRVVAAGLLLCLVVPPLGSGIERPFSLASLVWPGSDSILGLPLAVSVGLLLLWSSGRRVTAMLVAVGLLLAAGPLALDGGGDGVAAAGFAIPIAPDVPQAGEILGACALVALLAALGAAARLPALALVGLSAFFVAEPHLQAAAGQPAALWTGAEWQAPASLTRLRERPLSGTLVQLPVLDVEEGMVGLVPFHRQRISGGPGLPEAGPVRAALEQAMQHEPVLGSLSNVHGLAGAPRIPPTVLRDAGIVGVVLYGQDGERHAALQQLLGVPTSSDSRLTFWSTTPP